MRHTVKVGLSTVTLSNVPLADRILYTKSSITVEDYHPAHLTIKIEIMVERIFPCAQDV